MTTDNKNLDHRTPSQDKIADHTDSATKIADHTAEHKLPAPGSVRDAPRDDLIDQNRTHLKKQDGGYIELLEERPVINKERLDVGRVRVTKHARTKTIDVPIELIEEYLTVQTDFYDAESEDLLSGDYDDKDVLRHASPALDSKAVVTINGKRVEIGDEPVDIVISRQVATITKDTYAVQEVQVSKTTHTHTDTIQVELKYEELDVEEEGFLSHESSHDHRDH